MPRGLAFGCFVQGLALGAAGTHIVTSGCSGTRAVDAAVREQFRKVAEASERAGAACRHGSKPVAIYAQSQLLIELNRAGESPRYVSFLPEGAILFDMMLAHARLAKLYGEMHQSELSTQQVAQALECANRARNCSTITNWTDLAELVERIDHNARD
jgi:hypothetical protein